LDQPHAIAHVLQPTLWGENQKREPVSITGDAQRTVPHARELRPALRRGIRSSGLDTADDAALHVRCRPFCDVLIPPNGRQKQTRASEIFTLSEHAAGLSSRRLTPQSQYA
jgi:hypothetical protein